MTRDTTFPAGFLWGSATSAYQIEGAPLADGAGPSIWHRFAHTPGMIANGDTGDVACDHYHRLADDIALMRELGLTAYRFSISWSRIFPEGRGHINAAGLAFYERLVDTLLANGIAPLATLYHWDLPAALDDLGGWTNPDVAHWFGDYASTMYRHLDDRVRSWATLNEPWVVTDGGYLHGALAPGRRCAWAAARAAHHLLRAHGTAVRAYRAEGRHDIGIVVNIEPKHAASTAPADLAATQRADAYMNRQFLDPLFLGRYPDEMTEMFGEAWPDWPQDDFALIAEPIDFLGVNYYTRSVNRDDPTAWPVRARQVPQTQSTRTETAWEVYPPAFTELLLWIKQRYGNPPLFIMENGSAFYDPPTATGGRVHDPLRVETMRAHLLAVHEASAQGVDLRGYMVWSLLDNLEWAHGFSKRFGIVHVDFATQQRTLKDSARYYARVVASNGAVLVEPLDEELTWPR